MDTVLIQIAGFSLMALAILAVAERRAWRNLGLLQRLALLLLLALPLCAWLPKWHILPAAAVAPAAEGLSPGSGAGWLALWLAGVLVQTARLAASHRLLDRCRKASRALTDQADLALAALCASSVGMKRAVELRVCPALGGPAACGVLRPQVLLPPRWRQWDAETKRAVLLHEISHHASRDPLWRMLALGAAALYWFNPLAWWLAKRLQCHAEYACDARVVGCGIRPERYAHILCDLAGQAPSPALAMAAPGSLEQRVRMLQHQRALSPVVLALAAAALATCAIAVAIVRPGAPQAPPASDRQPAAYPPAEITTRQTANPFPADE